MVQENNEKDTKSHSEFKPIINYAEDGFTFEFGSHIILVTDKKYGCFAIEVIEKDSQRNVFVRPLGKSAINLTKIGSSVWTDFRKLIGLQEEAKNSFTHTLVDAARNLKKVRKVEASVYKLTQKESEEAIAILYRNDLYNYIKKTLDKVLIKEDLVKQTVFHIYLSTYTGSPFSIKLEGAPRSGKDAIAGKTLDLFPPEDVDSFTSGMSRRAIEWMAASEKDNNYVVMLKNKIWYFADIDENTGDILG